MENKVPAFINSDETFDVDFGYFTFNDYDHFYNKNMLSPVYPVMSDFDLPDMRTIGCAIDALQSKDRKKNLNIFVDNNISDISMLPGACLFIDHHLIEIVKGERNSSNALLMYRNLKKIYDFLVHLFSENSFANILVFYHSDIDGISSGYMMARILQLIKENKPLDVNEFYECMLYGELGDLSENVDSIFGNEYTFISKKVVRLSTKYCSIILKSIRPYLNPVIFDKGCQDTAYLDANKAVAMISEINMKITMNSSINAKHGMRSLMTFLNTDTRCDFIYKDYSMKKEELVGRFIESKEPNIFYKGSYNGTDYIVMLIDSPYDIGRSVMWSIKAKLPYLLYNTNGSTKKKNPSNWAFSLVADVDDKDEFVSAFDNMICYNLFLEKGASHSKDGSAFEMGKEFGGGGHDTNDGSLGSFECQLGDFFEKLDLRVYGI